MQGLLSSTKKGNDMFKKFTERRLLQVNDERISIFKPIRNPKLKTGLEQATKVLRLISVLKEDRQAFCSMMGKNVSPEESLSHPFANFAIGTPLSRYRS